MGGHPPTTTSPTHRRLWVAENCDLGSFTPFFSTHTHDRWGGSQASDFLASLSLFFGSPGCLCAAAAIVWRNPKIVPRIIHGNVSATPPTRFSSCCYSAIDFGSKTIVVSVVSLDVCAVCVHTCTFEWLLFPDWLTAGFYFRIGVVLNVKVLCQFRKP
jgi:hypothetical protein